MLTGLMMSHYSPDVVVEQLVSPQEQTGVTVVLCKQHSNFEFSQHLFIPLKKHKELIQERLALFK